jgi:hypothetical protein
MKTTRVQTPTSLGRFGSGRRDITPPVGIYARMWGAATEDRATGIHRPLFAEVLVFESVDESKRAVRVQLDSVGMADPQQGDMVRAAAEAADVPESHVSISYSHTHSSGWMLSGRIKMPGGEMIPAYWNTIEQGIREAAAEAVAKIEPATISYARAKCAMAANRDCRDEQFDGYVCGFNPDDESHRDVTIARVTDKSGRIVHSIVHYGCHPTTLAWDNSLISPDFVGALRETVEKMTEVPCTYFQAPCGEIGPRHGFVGDTGVADRNGRQVGYAALSALESLGPPEHDFVYQGPVISGATVGAWDYEALDGEHRSTAQQFDVAQFEVDLPLGDVPDPATLEREVEEGEAQFEAAREAGDELAGRDARAMAERSRRWLARLESLPTGDTFTCQYSVLRIGDAVFANLFGEPYSNVQTELQDRFPDVVIIVSPLSSNMQAAYLLPRDRYGLGLYQEEPSPLEPGCLEILIEDVAGNIEQILGRC